MTRAIVHTYTIVHEYRRQITVALIAACLVFAGLYAVNLYRVVSNTIALREAASQIASVSASVDSLDAQYLVLSGSITPDILRKYGLGQGTVSAFISRAASLGHVAPPGHEL